MIMSLQEAQERVNLRREDFKKRKEKVEVSEISENDARIQVENLVFHLVVFSAKGLPDGVATAAARSSLSKLYIHNPNSSVNWRETLIAFKNFLETNKVNGCPCRVSRN